MQRQGKQAADVHDRSQVTKKENWSHSLCKSSSNHKSIKNWAGTFQHHTTRLFVGHSLVVGGVAFTNQNAVPPTVCHLAPQILEQYKGVLPRALDPCISGWFYAEPGPLRHKGV